MNEISVIIPTFQHARTIASCLDSLCSQTLLPKELIVLDDGSTDETKKIVTSYPVSVVYQYQQHAGAPMARNRGAELATGTFLLFCDADIVTFPTMLEDMYRVFMDHPEVDVCYSGFLWGNRVFKSRPFDVPALQVQNYLHTTSLIRTTAFPGFDPFLKRFQDWDLWLTMVERGSTAFALDQVLFRVQDVPGRKGISTWMPSIFYKIPWNIIGWKPQTMKDFERARDIILTKHHLV